MDYPHPQSRWQSNTDEEKVKNQQLLSGTSQRDPLSASETKDAEDTPSNPRGIYLLSEEKGDFGWIEALKNGLQFDDADDCNDFVCKYCIDGSNPQYSLLLHIFTTTITWNQLNSYIIEKLDEYNNEFVPKPSILQLESLRGNKFLKEAAGGKLHELLKDSLGPTANPSIFNMISTESSVNTLKYMFFNIRSGVFVLIRDNKLVMFVPFVNKDYVNSGWAEELQFSQQYNNQEELYYEAKWMLHRKEHIHPEKNGWWNDGPLIGNEIKVPGFRGPQYVSDKGLPQWRAMLEEACQSREIPDCEFFLNALHHPAMKLGENGELKDPCGFLFDKDDMNPKHDISLNQHTYLRHTPIASSYLNRRANDIRWPSPEDWEIATGKVYPASFIHQVRDELVIEPARDIFSEKHYKHRRTWEEKLSTAFFRGRASGGGSCASTNQRIKLAEISQKHKEESPRVYLDAEITQLDFKDKKVKGEPLDFAHPERLNIDISRDSYVPIYKQSKYKYLIYVDGNSASSKYTYLMQTGSVILKVESQCHADELWYFPILRPMHDYVPVKADLSDLMDQIRWCREHDAECRQIAENAMMLYRSFVSKQGILDYIQLVAHEVSTRYKPMPSWWDRPQNILKIPELNLPKGKCSEHKKTGPRLCIRCRRTGEEEKQKEQDAFEEQQVNEKIQKEKAHQKKADFRSRMKRNAAQRKNGNRRKGDKDRSFHDEVNRSRGSSRNGGRDHKKEKRRKLEGSPRNHHN